MRILITGGSGFIGSSVSDRLGQDPDMKVHSVVRTEARAQNSAVRYIPANLSEQGWTRKLPVESDVVIHLAQSTRYREFPEAALDIGRVNIDATLELADWARRAGVRRLIFASTGNVYGNSEQSFGEGNSVDPRSMYAVSKRCAEILLGCYRGFYEIVVLRLFGVYGPGQKGGLISQIIDRVLRNEEITLAGGIGVRLNPIYIDDCVSIISKLCFTKLRETYEILNVGGPEIVSVMDIAEAVGRVSGRRPGTRVTADKPISLIGNTQKLASMIPEWRATTLLDGLRRTMPTNEMRP